MVEFKYLDKAGVEVIASKIKELKQVVNDNAKADHDLASAVFASVDYSSADKKIVFKNVNDEQVGEINAADFVKDGMVESVELTEENKLVITFNTDSGKEKIELDLGDMFEADNYYTKEETDEAFVKYGEFNGHKVIYLNEDEQIGGLPKSGSGINMLQLRKYGSVEYPTVELGSTSATLTLNANGGKVAIDGGAKQEIVATVSDVEAATENVVKYTPFNLGNEERKTILLEKRDTISSGGCNIAMVSDYEGLDFSVVELGSSKGAMVINTNDQPAKIEITEGGRRVQHVIATVDDIEAATDDVVRYTPFENRKTIVLAEGDTISSMGVNLGMVKTYAGLNYPENSGLSGLMPVLEVGGTRGALVLNSCEDRVKVEVVENGKRVQHAVATVDDLEHLLIPFTKEEIEAMFE